MNVTSTLNANANKLTNADDDEKKLNTLLSLISIHKNYKESKKFLRERPSVLHLSHSSTLSSSFPEAKTPLLPTRKQIPRRSLTQAFSFFSKKKICNSDIDNDQELEFVRKIFEKILQMQGLEEKEAQNTISYHFIVQFLLDCCIATQHFMALFCMPLCKKQRISLEQFVMAMESLQQMKFEKASFFYQERDGQFRRNIAIQKTFCESYAVFFKAFEYVHGNELDEADLEFVMALALRKAKSKEYNEGHKILVKNTFEKNAEMHGHSKQTINFKEFYGIILDSN